MTAALPLVKKVEGLIALTTSDRPEEARTSAYLACKIIREHGLHVVAEPPQLAQISAPAPDAQPKVIRTKFDSLCLDCRAEIYAGERCTWLKGRGCWHVECSP